MSEREEMVKAIWHMEQKAKEMGMMYDSMFCMGRSQTDDEITVSRAYNESAAAFLDAAATLSMEVDEIDEAARAQREAGEL